MTWMTRKLIVPFPLFALVLSLSAVGCGPSEKDLKIQDLQAENDQLKSELNDRDRQMNDAIVRENDARDTIDQLNRELSTLQADASKAKDAEGWVTMPTFDMISVPGSVLFASGKADLTRNGRRTLSKIASDIRDRFGDRDIYVFGHTDNEPIRKSKWKDNWELGAARSMNVIRALRDFGISNESLVQANCAQYRPRSSNTKRKGRAKNRRVEFYAVNHSSGIMNESTARRYEDD
ncbi:MAG: OmpA family protein [Phycisphaerae bacterium]